MKNSFFLSAVLVIGLKLLTTGQNISLELSPKHQVISPGEDISYDLTLTSDSGFMQQIFFGVASHDMAVNEVSFAFSPLLLNFPYGSGIFNISTEGTILPGDYTIVVEAANGPVSDIDTCYLSVVSDSCLWTELNPPYDESLVGIMVDNNNHVWVTSATTAFGKGLMKFDGFSWTSYGRPANTEIQGNPTVDSANNIWVPTDGGVAKFDGLSWTVYNTTNSQMPSNDVRSVAVDTNNHVWVGTYDAGLVRYDHTFWSVYDASNSPLIRNRVRRLQFDKTGKLWFVTIDHNYDAMVGNFDGSTFNFISVANSCIVESSENAFPFAFDNDNNLWLGGTDGVMKFDGSQWEWWKDNGQNDNHTIMDLNCNIISTDSSSPLIYEHCNSIFIDSENNVWISNRRGGGVPPPGELLKYDGIKWTKYTPHNSTLPDNTVFYMAESINRDLWFITLPSSLGPTASISVYSCNPGFFTNIINPRMDIVSWKLYPNPTDGLITLAGITIQQQKIDNIQIRNTLGQVIYYEEFHKRPFSLDLKSLAGSGIFYLTLSSSSSQFVETKKVVVLE